MLLLAVITSAEGTLSEVQIDYCGWLDFILNYPTFRDLSSDHISAFNLARHTAHGLAK